MITCCSLTLLLAASNLFAAPFAYIPNDLDSTVSVIDLATNTVVATIPVGMFPYGVAANLAGTRVYVTNVGDDSTLSSVSVIDTSLNRVIATIGGGQRTPCDCNICHNLVSPNLVSLRSGPASSSGCMESDYFGLAVNPAGTTVYVADLERSSVVVIDAASNTVTATVPVGSSPFGSEPFALAVDPSGRHVFVTNSNEDTVSVIDSATNVVVATVPVGLYPQGIAINSAGTRAYVASHGDSHVSVIDTSTNVVIARVLVGFNQFGIATNPAGTRVYMTEGYWLREIDALSNTLLPDVVDLAGAPGVEVDPTGAFVYAVNTKFNTVSVIDAASAEVVATIPVGAGPTAFGLFIGGVSLVPAPLIADGPPPNGTVGVAYDFAYAATGSPTFSVTSGGLPPGLSISAKGEISGIPTAAGRFFGTVRASNGIVPDAAQAFSITIRDETARRRAIRL